jgi:hypothetical protein
MVIIGQVCPSLSDALTSFRAHCAPSHRNRCEGALMHPTPIEVESDALLAEAQAARLLNLSVRTLQAWRTKRSGPSFVRAGRAIRYRRRDLYAWMDANTVSLTRPDAALGRRVS